MSEPVGVDPAADVSPPEPHLPPAVLARLAAMASQRAFLAFVPNQERFPA